MLPLEPERLRRSSTCSRAAWTRGIASQAARVYKLLHYQHGTYNRRSHCVTHALWNLCAHASVHTTWGWSRADRQLRPGLMAVSKPPPTGPCMYGCMYGCMDNLYVWLYGWIFLAQRLVPSA